MYQNTADNVIMRRHNISFDDYITFLESFFSFSIADRVECLGIPINA